jgi:signal transduction histidine kinase
MASESNEDNGEMTCLLFEPDNFEQSLVDHLIEMFGSESVAPLDHGEVPDSLSDGRRVILYREGDDIGAVGELFQTVRRADADEAVVCVVDDGDWRAGNAALRDGAADYLFVEQFDSPHLAEILRASVERGLADSRRSEIQRELEARSSELLGVNALANGVSSSLDRDVIVRRGLWVFAGVCEQGAVALLELDPLPDIPNIGRESESGEPELQCVSSFSSSGLEEICGDVVLDASWRNVIFENHLAVLEDRPEDGRFPGLRPFWEQHPEGRATIVALHANQRPYGALVLADSDGEAADERVGRDGLEAMALQFASALENARLFQEVKDAYESLQETQDQLVHAEKFAAVGLLAAEIAHEINNPASFVISNLSVMVEYAETIAEYLDDIEALVDERAPELVDELERLQDDHDIEFLRDDIDRLLSRSLAGMERIHQVVQDLRYLSRDSDENPGWVEIESLLDATVNLVRHEAKFRADIERDYGSAPQVMSDPSRLSQVFLNVLVNAVQAIDADGRIRVTTESIDEAVRVTIEDTGTGIPEAMQSRIFEPFFSTKDTDEGTGLGLSISRDIVRSLGGRIDFDSEPGEGTTFRVTIPIRAEKFQRDEDLRESGYYDIPPDSDTGAGDPFDP